MKYPHLRRLFFAVLVLALSFTPKLLGQCGVERWSVKTGTDSGATSIDLNSSSATTISSLVAESAPQPIPVNSRVQPTETTVWTVDATLLEFKRENDSDYHLVLSDGAGNTMIAEIPSPTCVGAGSPFASAIAQARSQFDATFTVGSSFQQANVPVQVTGVGMFDFLHGATGAAPNGVELHPVLKINFGGGLSLSASPSVISTPPGGTASLTVSATSSGDSKTSVSFSVSGNPSGVAATFSPLAVTPPGTTSMTLSVGQSAVPGNYTLTIAGSGGGNTSSTTVALMVNQGGSDFSLSASPAALAVLPGTPVPTIISSTLNGSFGSDVSFSALGLPAGVNASFNPSTIPSPGSGSSTLTIAADSSAAGGNFSFQVVGSGGGTTHQTGIAVNICTAPQQSPISNSLPLHAQERGLRNEISAGGITLTTDDDDGRFQIVPSKEALVEARQHGGELICRPRQSDVFLGSGWGASGNRERKSRLAQVSASLHAPTICRTGAALAAPTTHEELDGIEGDISDLQIQTRLAAMFSKQQLEPPSTNSIYVVFLAPQIQSKIGGHVGGRSYLAYHNHFHGSDGEIRYAVVPFDSDRQREERTTSLAILNMLVNPDGVIQ
jgi:hypothetical protein